MGILSSRMPTLVCPRVPFSKPTPGAFFGVAKASPQMCLWAGKEIPREGGWAKENLFFAMLVSKKECDDQPKATSDFPWAGSFLKLLLHFLAFSSVFR